MNRGGYKSQVKSRTSSRITQTYYYDRGEKQIKKQTKHTSITPQVCIIIIIMYFVQRRLIHNTLKRSAYYTCCTRLLCDKCDDIVFIIIHSASVHNGVYEVYCTSIQT